MKRNLSLLAILLTCTLSWAGTPVIDGVFDGTGVWGANLGGANLGVGWPGCCDPMQPPTSANAKQIYITSDATYIYLGAAMDAASWMKVGFVINTKSGGGLKDPWTHGIDYIHSDKPDYVVEVDLGGNMGAGYAEVRSWNGTEYAAPMSPLAATDMGKVDASFIEVRILKSALDNPVNVQAQFFISGNADHEHGVFDAIPFVFGTDTQQSNWNGTLGATAPYTKLGTYTANAVIPIEMISFYAKPQSQTVKLDWLTATERNNAYFDVQRSTDGQTWTNIGTVKGNGTTASKQTYNFTDDAPLSRLNYYRLKQVDFDGKSDFSSVVAVNMASNGKGFSVYPNPVSDKLNVLSYDLDTEGSVQVFDMKGSLIKTTKLVNNQLIVNDLPIGSYQMRLVDRNGATTEITRFVKQ